MRIKNAKIYQPDGTFKETDLVTDGEYIKSDAKADHEIVDGFELFAIPALIDVHVSQCGELHFDEGGNFAIDKISDLEAQNGVLTWYGVTKLPAAHAEKAARFMDTWNTETAPLHPECADLAGLVLERPIAHIQDAKPSDESWKDLAYDDADEFAKIEADTKKAFKLIEVDAAQPGADKYISLVSKEAQVAIVDTDPSFADAEKAFKAGVVMAQRYWGKECVLDPKRPTVLQAVLQNDGKFLQLLVGEDNVDKRNVTSTFAEFQDKIVLSSSDGNLYDAMKRLIELGVPAADAINACTVTPALALKVADKMGTLEDGKLANILLVDKDFHIRHVIHRGKMVI
ncbi:amidohydrolase family protein [Olsenella sp. YH-ols2217]|uniref:Amidohydrolase family protein n=1 Tax=Kribbibacterium absianum TaxID=3044210 RepID=A0ABT6ZI41_9ACTN|nr:MULTISPECIES: amidohydrolase family protein [unclassified Olsenella]MDJ1121233.1 amidohydrolase family protein [Olsenella sp. YH-ols2216]MDJ1128723.1 amidohydrolase family protein [Olsenella sp. YH-ols2217]